MRQFPILIGFRGTKGPCPSSIPWEVIAPYEKQAQLNHQQSLETLAGRGGLDPMETFYVMTGRTWRGVAFTEELEREACAYLEKLVRDREQVKAERDLYKFALERISHSCDGLARDTADQALNAFPVRQPDERRKDA